MLLPALFLALGGCGGIEFQGKVFDYMGLSGNMKREDVRMSDRAPLVLPPDTKRLPAPGAAPIDRADWPVDSDAARKKMIAAKETAEQKESKINDPINPYAGKPNLLDKIFARKKTIETPPDVPEPDPTDKTTEDRGREQAAATAQKPVDQSLNAPTPPEGDDPFRPAAPKSYETMSNPSGTGIE